VVEIAKTVISEQDETDLTAKPDENELAVQSYFNNSLNQKYKKANAENPGFGVTNVEDQHAGKMIFQKQERIEAEYKKDSGEWSAGKIQGHDDYFEKYFVYFEDGRTATLPPEQIRKLSPYELGKDLTDEEKVIEFYKMMGCDKLETVK